MSRRVLLDRNSIRYFGQFAHIVSDLRVREVPVSDIESNELAWCRNGVVVLNALGPVIRRAALLSFLACCLAVVAESDDGDGDGKPECGFEFADESHDEP